MLGGVNGSQIHNPHPDHKGANKLMLAPFSFMCVNRLFAPSLLKMLK